MKEFGALELLEGVPPVGRAWLEENDLRGLDCGCGKHPTAGWLNVDFRPFGGPDGRTSAPGRIALLDEAFYFLEHDLREPLPIEDESFAWIYSSHLIEHTRPPEAIRMLREMRRLLRPGGLIRVSAPSLRRYIEGYLDPERAFFEEHRRRLSSIPIFADGVPDRPAWMVNQVFYLWGHRWIYDVDEIRYVAVEAGFDPSAVVETGYGESQAAELSAMDPEGRNDVSLYVDIRREA